MPEMEHDQGYGFGTFKGVFTPSILTIFGVVMYLRFGWVVGNAGIPKTLLIVTMSTSITFLTGLSLSALATNMKVGTGGAYYVISRSLGLEPGAAVGLPLFLAQGLGISFYISGFAEVVVDTFPGYDLVHIGVITLVGVAFLAYVSANLALKSQFIIMAVVAASLVSFFAGSGARVSEFAGDVEPVRESFWYIFAVFFPAVTGIEAGISMSGDLKDPAKSLPLGTMAAVLTGYLAYMIIPFYLAVVVKDHRVLMTNMLVMRDIARWPDFIIYGVLMAAISSAMGLMLGAPRTMQALAHDRVLPSFLGRAYGKGKNPRIATAVTFLVALTGVLLGDLNAIAPVLTMFFLTSYALINVSAGIESLIGTPSWRPKFRVHWSISLAGAFGCFAVMFMINAGATFIAAFLSLGLYYYMTRRSLQAQWGDMRYGVLMHIARFAVSRMARDRPDERTWQPNILVLCGPPTTRWYLIELADAIAQGRSFLTVAAIVPESRLDGNRAESIEESIEQHLKKKEIPALVKLYPFDDHLVGARYLISGYGFGPLEPNTILLGQTKQTEHFDDYCVLIQEIQRTRRNLVIVREGDEDPEFKGGRRIDVWWRGKRENVGLMLSLAWLLNQNPRWAEGRLVLKTIVGSEEERDEVLKASERFIKSERLQAETEVAIVKDGDPFETIRSLSIGASLVFLGMRAPEETDTVEAYSRYYEELLTRTEGLPPTVMVMAAEDIEFHRIFESD